MPACNFDDLICLLCKEAINKKIEGLGNVAKEAILFSNTADLNDADNNEDQEVPIKNCSNVPTVNADQIGQSVSELKARITNFSSNCSFRNPYKTKTSKKTYPT